MTNGEKIQTILDVDRDCIEVHGENGTMTFSVPQEWWDAEYKEPTTKNDLGVDAISRADALDCVNWGYNLSDVYKKINELPSVTPQSKTGHWIADVDRWGDVVTTVNGYRCDKCNAFNSDKDNYCPNCGAKMRGEEE